MPDPPPVPTRLSKYLREHAALSHHAIKSLWQQGRIGLGEHGVAPKPVTALRRTYVFEGDLVTLDGTPVPRRRAPKDVWMLHKPLGVVSTTNDPQGRPCLGRWLATLPEGVFPVGRLDRETSGLILLTNDGDLTFLLLSPQFHVQKLYEVGLWEPLQEPDDRLDLLCRGVDIKDGKGKASATCVRQGEGGNTFILGIKEGRNRQVRKMCRAAGLGLKTLHRTHVGPLALGGLEVEEVRRLEEGEVDALWNAAGGRHVPRMRALGALQAHVAYERAQGTEPLWRVERWLACHQGEENKGETD